MIEPFRLAPGDREEDDEGSYPVLRSRMFGWFKKKAPAAPPFDDRVWIDEAARLRAVLCETGNGPTLIVTFFEESAARVAAALRSAGVPFAEVGTSLAAWSDGRVYLCLADRLRHLVGDLPDGLRVIVFEHHPHPSDDRAFLEALAARTAARPVFHTALDEPLLRRFGGDRTAAVMARMGMSPDEPIEHALVTRAMTDMREKVAAKVKVSREARSMAECVERHLD